ncbi:hypothetical protein MY10362_001212 [Beauveria mimosiformis]
MASTMRAMANLDGQQASSRRRQDKKTPLPACFGKRNSVGPAPRGQAGGVARANHS